MYVVLIPFDPMHALYMKYGKFDKEMGLNRQNHREDHKTLHSLIEKITSSTFCHSAHQDL